MAETSRNPPVAVIGMAGRFPRADGLDAFWRLVRDGVEVIDDVTEADLDAARVPASLRQDPHYVRKATVLEGADTFDAAFFGFSPREAQVLDPQQRVFLECAWEALEHAGWAGAAAGQAVGVYAGTGLNTYLLTQLLANPAFVASVGAYQVMLGSDKDFLATRVSYKLDLRGPSVTVQSACSTSLVAVVMACRALQRGECDLALAGGVSIAFPQRAGYLHEEGLIHSPDGHCRPFDAAAAGTRTGSGAGVVVLKRLDLALAEGDTVHAVVLGAAVNNDGASKAGFTAPSVEGQVEVIATAQALAEVDPRTIGYVEAHGTGTPLGDQIETAALTQVFRSATSDVGFCRLGSLKASLGSLDAAGGVAGLIKTVLALRNRELPPLVNFTRPHPALALETSPFSASARAAPWVTSAGVPRRAGVNAFGVGGTNAHLVLEEAPSLPPRPPRAREARLLVLSARTPTALERAAEALARALEADPPLEDVAWTLQAGRRAFAHRRAVVARTAEAAARALRGGSASSGVFEGAARPVAFLLGGPGPDPRPALAALGQREPAFRAALDGSAAVAARLGLDLLGALSAQGPLDDRVELALRLALDAGLAALWASWGVVPDALLVDHGPGALAAAHLAGVLTLEDALAAAVAPRGDPLPGARLAPPTLPVAVGGAWLTAALATSPATWSERLRGARTSVEEGVRLLAADPATLLLELGPGDALAAAARSALGPGGAARVASSLAPGVPADEAVLLAAGRLWASGASPDWRGLHAGESPRRIPLPVYPFERRRCWVEAAVPPPEPVRGAAAASASAPGVAGGAALAPASVEETLAAIWKELLGVESVGPDHEFFALGGHSLLATRVLARVEQALGVRLALRDVFEAPTLRQLAARISGARAAARAPAAETADREELEF